MNLAYTSLVTSLGRGALASILSFTCFSKLSLIGYDPGDVLVIPIWVIATTGGVEFVMAIILLTKWWRRGAWITASLGAIFVAAAAIVISTKQRNANCGCFGAWKLADEIHFLLAFAVMCLALWLGVRGSSDTRGVSV